jgi:hypothetical protein
VLRVRKEEDVLHCMCVLGVPSLKRRRCAACAAVALFVVAESYEVRT